MAQIIEAQVAEDSDEGHSKLVLESPVKSGFSALNGFNRNRNRLN